VAIKTNLANDFSTWSTNLIALANCSNVYMKIGGVGMPIFALGKLSPRHQSSVLELFAHVVRCYFLIFNFSFFI
jgi:predicted TIM-barrel fold metal-dependent hydrolase